MKTYNSLQSYTNTSPSVITIGTFDGVHVGHQKIIKKLAQLAKKEKCNSVVLTFFPHPRMVLQKDSNIKLINSIKERAQLLENNGLDTLIIHPFDKEFAKLSALSFVKEVLVKKLHVSKLVIGYDHHFGKNREGNIEQLKEYAHTYNFEIIEIPAQDINEVAISSTKIRKALNEGNIEKTNTYLNYQFTLSGKIVKGNNIGEKIGFPTANIHLKEDYKLIPKKGAYIVSALIDEKKVFGMLNIGNRPTINDEKETIEVHFLNFNKNIYGKKISISFIKRLRDEQRFNSLEDLKKQLGKDKNNTKLYLESNVE